MARGRRKSTTTANRGPRHVAPTPSSEEGVETGHVAESPAEVVVAERAAGYREDDEQPAKRRKVIANARKRKGKEEEEGDVDAQATLPSESVQLETPLPDKNLLQPILDKIQEVDKYGAFSEPVDLNVITDYLLVIKTPMDFRTVRERLARGAYANLEQFEKDVFLISSNAMQYNKPRTVYHKQGRSMQELARKEFSKLRSELKSAGVQLEPAPKSMASQQSKASHTVEPVLVAAPSKLRTAILQQDSKVELKPGSETRKSKQSQSLEVPEPVPATLPDLQRPISSPPDPKALKVKLKTSSALKSTKSKNTESLEVVEPVLDAPSDLQTVVSSQPDPTWINEDLRPTSNAWKSPESQSLEVVEPAQATASPDLQTVLSLRPHLKGFKVKIKVPSSLRSPMSNQHESLEIGEPVTAAPSDIQTVISSPPDPRGIEVDFKAVSKTNTFNESERSEALEPVPAILPDMQRSIALELGSEGLKPKLQSTKSKQIESLKVVEPILDTPSNLLPTKPLPERKVLEDILDKIQEKDKYGVFSEPVDLKELPDYLDVIRNPMDFRTVRKNLETGSYSNLEQFERDVLLISSNAMQYNRPHTVFYKQAQSMEELGNFFFEALRLGPEAIEAELQTASKTKGCQSSKKGTKEQLGATVASRGEDAKEFSVSAVKEPRMKIVRKPLYSVEGHRHTYKKLKQEVNKTEQIMLNTLGDLKQLVPSEGIQQQYAYARSLARFGVGLGPLAWKIVTQKIQRALPLGVRFGPGWVGEDEMDWSR